MFTARKNESAIDLTDAAELADERRRQAPGYISDMSNNSSFVTTPAELRSPSPEGDENEEGKSEIPRTQSEALDLFRIRQPSFSKSDTVTLGNHDGIHIILPPSAAHATSTGTLSMLHRCVVDMSKPTFKTRPFATLYLKNTQDSLIVIGHVNGAAHVTNVSNSVIVVASQQFRIHESQNCDVYLLTPSRPIIDDSTRIRFAPLPEKYMNEADKDVENQWQNVDDFKWLRSEPSPNWSVLDESQRIPAEVWKDIVPGGPKYGVEEILKAVKISG